MEDKPLKRTYGFKSYDECIDFSNFVMNTAKEMNHHPEILTGYNRVVVTSISHDKGGVTDRDEKLIVAIDQHYKENYGDDNEKSSKSAKNHDLSLIKIYTDGGSRGNPGPSASGYVIYDANDKVIVRAANYIGITTNNQAEYISIKNALACAKKISGGEALVFMDSQLVINQLNGVYQVKNKDLWPIYESVKELAKNFKKIRFTHTPREFNKVADALVNESLDKKEDIIYNS